MRRMWDSIVLPLFKELKPNDIIEIGSEEGINTKKILHYCVQNNSHLTTIDPNPLFDEDELLNQFDGYFNLIKDLSLNCLQELDDYDMILIDGDHNWYTVYNELKLIEKKFSRKKFPIIILHDVGWPYGRRDLYYNPDSIPDEFLHAYTQKGMFPDKSELLDVGGLNHDLNNAIYENGSKNGVLTAIEDFLSESTADLLFSSIMGFHGLGIIYPNDDNIKLKINKIIDDSDIVLLMEKYYLKDKILYLDKISELNYLITSLNNNVTKLLNTNYDLTQEKVKLFNENNDLMKINKDLNNINSSFNHSRQMISYQRDSLINENVKLASYNSSLVKSKKILLEKYDSLVDENEKLANRNFRLVKSKKALLDKYGALKVKNEELANRNDNLTQTKAHLHKKNNSLNSEKAILLNNYFNLLDENKRLINLVNSLNASLSQHKIEKNNQNAYINKLILENNQINKKSLKKNIFYKIKNKLFSK